MIPSSCHCGAVRLEIASAPDEVKECNCSICRRTGAICAYYKLAEVRIEGPTDIYMWGDRSIEFHRCKVCGCFMYWWPAMPDYDRMGVNARMMAPEILAAARVVKFDGASM